MYFYFSRGIALKAGAMPSAGSYILLETPDHEVVGIAVLGKLHVHRSQQ